MIGTEYMLGARVKVNYITIVKVLITTGLIAYLMYSCNIAMLAATLSNINISSAILTSVMLLLVFIIGGVNLWLMLNSIANIPLRAFIQSYSYGSAINLLTPGQLGDISVALFLKQHGIFYSRSTLAYIIDKAISMVCILLIGYMGYRFILKQYVGSWWILGIPLTCIVASIISVVLIVYMPYKHERIGRARQFIINMYNEFMVWDNKYSAMLLNIMLTIIKWFIVSCAYYMAFYSFGVKVAWPEVGIIPIISTLIGYIPISVGGIGTVELCAVYLFSLISIDRVYVIDVYIFLRAITYLQAGVILGLCNWQFRGARIL